MLGIFLGDHVEMICTCYQILETFKIGLCCATWQPAGTRSSLVTIRSQTQFLWLTSHTAMSPGHMWPGGSHWTAQI